MTDKITKFIKSLNSKTRANLKKKLIEIRKNPHTANNIKKLNNWGKDCFRARIGKIRIIYKIKNKKIEIIDIDYRGNIY